MIDAIINLIGYLGAVDWLVLFFIFFMAVRGCRNGLCKELSGTMTLFFAIFLGWRLYKPLYNLVGQVAPSLDQTNLGQLVTFLLCLGGIYYGSKFTGYLVRSALNGFDKNKGLDRYIGGFTGLVTGGLIYLSTLLVVTLSGSSTLKSVFIDHSVFGTKLQSDLPASYDKLAKRWTWLPQVDNAVNYKGGAQPGPNLAPPPKPTLPGQGNRPNPYPNQGPYRANDGYRPPYDAGPPSQRQPYDGRLPNSRQSFDARAPDGVYRPVREDILIVR